MRHGMNYHKDFYKGTNDRGKHPTCPICKKVLTVSEDKKGYRDYHKHVNACLVKSKGTA